MKLLELFFTNPELSKLSLILIFIFLFISKRLDLVLLLNIFSFCFSIFFSFVLDQNFDSDDTNWSSRFNGFIRLPKDYSLQFFGFVRGPSESAFSKRKAFGFVTGAIQKSLLDKKGTLSLKFSDLFNDLLKTQCVLKGVCTLEEWDEIKEHVQYNFIADNYFSEMKEKEVMNERLAMLQQMDPYAGKYFSVEYLRRNILRQTDNEMKELDEQMAAEIADGLVVSPVEMQQMEKAQMEMSMQPPEPPPEEPSLSEKDYKKGEI